MEIALVKTERNCGKKRIRPEFINDVNISALSRKCAIHNVNVKCKSIVKIAALNILFNALYTVQCYALCTLLCTIDYWRSVSLYICIPIGNM